MTEKEIILNRLLDKYENSRHVSEPGVSTRRVMLRIDRQELPEYDYENAEVRDVFNAAAQDLERQGLVSLEWVRWRPVLSRVILNLENVMLSYGQTERRHPRQRAEDFIASVQETLERVTVPWIVSWRDEVLREAREQTKVPAFCRNQTQPLLDLLHAFREYDALTGSVTMRAFSGKCFSDTKYFERNVRENFLRIARKHDPGLAQACTEDALGERDQLAVLGIYARPELYELSGNCTVGTNHGTLWLGAASPYGLALPSTLVDSITEIDLRDIRCVTFIENKTNYDEYLLTEQQPDELVVFHGGFLSPQKRKLFSLLDRWAPDAVRMRFWADIDLGGFRMFAQLQNLIPRVEPMRMSVEFVEQYHENGLARSETYLSALQTELQNGEHEVFAEAIHAILKYGVTIEQELFLN